jgi:hypothetical protein
MTEPRRLFVVDIIPSHVLSKEDTKSTKFRDWSLPATFTPEIHCAMVWAKFKALAEGARIATKQFW